MSREDDRIRRIVSEELRDVLLLQLDDMQDHAELPDPVIETFRRGFGLEGVKAELETIEQLIRTYLIPSLKEQGREVKDPPEAERLLENPPEGDASPEEEANWLKEVWRSITGRDLDLDINPVHIEINKPASGPLTFVLGSLMNKMSGLPLWLRLVLATTYEAAENGDQMAGALANVMEGYMLWRMRSSIDKMYQNQMKIENEVNANAKDIGKVQRKLDKLNPERESDKTLDIGQRLKVIQSDLDDIRGLLRQATVGTRYL